MKNSYNFDVIVDENETKYDSLCIVIFHISFENMMYRLIHETNYCWDDDISYFYINRSYIFRYI